MKKALLKFVLCHKQSDQPLVAQVTDSVLYLQVNNVSAKFTGTKLKDGLFFIKEVDGDLQFSPYTGEEKINMAEYHDKLMSRIKPFIQDDSYTDYESVLGFKPTTMQSVETGNNFDFVHLTGENFEAILSDLNNPKPWDWLENQQTKKLPKNMHTDS